MLTRLKPTSKQRSHDSSGSRPLAVWVGGAALLLAALLWRLKDTGPGWRLAGAAGGGYVLFKLAAIAGPQRTEFVALTSEAKLLFGLPWPGFDAGRFKTRTNDGSSQDRLVGGGVRLLAGTFVMMVAASNLDEWGEAAAWLGVTGILLIVHLGYADLLTWVARDRGYAVRPLFDRPWASRSLAEFWTRRWNVAFVEMDRILFLPILRRWLDARAAAFGVFLISGVLHELAISYPAGSGFGKPMAYFGIHGIAVYAERTIVRVHNRPLWLARTWTVLVVVIPLPLLFHEAFRTELIVPLLEVIGQVLS